MELSVDDPADSCGWSKLADTVLLLSPVFAKYALTFHTAPSAGCRARMCSEPLPVGLPVRQTGPAPCAIWSARPDSHGSGGTGHSTAEPSGTLLSHASVSHATSNAPAIDTPVT